MSETPAPKIDLRKLCMMLYGVYAGSMLMQFSMTTVIAGTVFMLLGLLVTYAKRKTAADTPYESHFRWMLRTFWIGGGIYLPVMTVFASVILYSMIDMTAIYDGIASGAIASEDQILQALMENNKQTLLIVTLSFTVPFAAWWLWRCWQGFRHLREEKPVPNVMSWV